ncbi:MAG TPA: hypothetical protein VKA10_05040 [Prolixibacteraceae bacterium]|nr:hypothetical protein [Prolixibacteraceae bacterium]
MKTINFNSKQILWVTILGLFILAGSVSAKGTETGFASSYENRIEQEQQLEVEDWMVNETLWKAPETSFSFVTEQESTLEIENWMVNENNWKPESIVLIENAKEKELTLDCWMVEENHWKM